MKLSLSNILKALGFGKASPAPVTPPKPVTPSSVTLRISVYGSDVVKDDKVPGAHVTVKSTSTSTQGEGDADGAGNIEFHNMQPGVYTVSVSAKGYEEYVFIDALSSGTFNAILTPAKLVHQTRQGIVRGDGHRFVDDSGPFYPLGHTFFWALRGWHAGGAERDRVKENMRWIATKAGSDFVRILGQVGWTGLEIRPEWAEYETDLAEFIDFAYDECGVRTQITLVGGGSYDLNQLVDKVINVVNARKHKVFLLEVANEWWSNWVHGEDKLKETGRKLKDHTGLLVTLSAPQTEEIGTVNKDWIRSGAANVGIAHFDRADNTVEFKWRHVRKPWESREPAFPSSSNEPGGPRSSVAQFEEAIHLVMARFTGIICQWDSYVLHNGAAIYGVQQDKNGGRPPNAWEIPGIDDLSAIVRRVDTLFTNASDGHATRAGMPGHPLRADKFMADDGRGVVRDYCNVRGDGFWQALTGLKDYVMLTADANYELQFINPLTLEVSRTERVTAGQSIRVEPNGAVDSRGLGAFIVKGTRV